MVGIVAINNFPMYHNAIFQLKSMCEKVIVRLDPHCEFENGAIDGVEFFRGEAEWDKWRWRQEMIMKVPPTDLVVNLDEDETFERGIEDEISRFKRSDKLVMMFDYKMVTEDSRKVEVYPSLPHCKVFRWQEGLSYHPYAGLCLPTEYANTLPEMKGKEFKSRVKINHWCLYTKNMEKNKVKV